MNPFDLTGRIALVTGARTGLGRAAADALAAAGATVVRHGREDFDLADEAATAAGIAGIVARHGRVDILVANAGARDRRAIGGLDRAAVRAVMEVNLVANLDLARLVAPHMPAGGRMVMVTSIAGTIARAGDAAYTASKAALDGLTKALAAELGPAGITVNAVAPGYFATEANAAMVGDEDTAAHLARRTALGRWGRPEEIAGAILFLASPAASYVTGATLPVDGGYLAHF